MLDQDENEIEKNDIESQPDDLRSQLVAALKGSETTETESPVETVSATRDAQGRFARAEAQAEAAPEKAAVQAPAASSETPVVEAQPTEAPASIRPPPGWSPASKAAFDALPDAVKADIGKREAEVNAGFARLQDYKGLESFADECKANNWTAAGLVERYRNADRMLNDDFVGGIVALCNTYQFHPSRLAETLAVAFGGSPKPNSEKPQESNNPDIAAYLAKQLEPLQKDINAFKQERHEQVRQAVNGQVNSFFDDPANPYADNVVHLMLPIIEAQKSRGEKVNLKDAYEAACWQDPQVRAQLINEMSQSGQKVQADAATRAKAAAKSVSGAPGQGSTPVAATGGSLRDELRRNLRSGRV